MNSDTNTNKTNKTPPEAADPTPAPTVDLNPITDKEETVTPIVDPRTNPDTDAPPASGQEPGDRLKALASDVSSSLKSLGLRGRAVTKVKGLCVTIRKAKSLAEQTKAAAGLADCLSKSKSKMARVSQLAAAITEALAMVSDDTSRAGGLNDTGDSGDSGDSGDVGGASPTTPTTPTTPADEPEAQPYGPAEPRDVEVAAIKTAEPFAGLFPANPTKIANLADDMRKHGYDPVHPIAVWKEAGVLLDGHCRCQAAEQAGVAVVPALYLSFPDEDTALDYAVRMQCARRNLTDADILSLVEKLDQRKQRGGDRRSDQAKAKTPNGTVVRSSEETALKIGVSSRMVERARKVIASHKEELINDVKAGKMPIHKAAASLPKKKRQKKAPTTATQQTAKKALNDLDKVIAYLKLQGDVFSEACTKLAELAEEIKRQATESAKRPAAPGEAA